MAHLYIGYYQGLGTHGLVNLIRAEPHAFEWAWPLANLTTGSLRRELKKRESAGRRFVVATQMDMRPSDPNASMHTVELRVKPHARATLNEENYNWPVQGMKLDMIHLKLRQLVVIAKPAATYC